MSGGDSEVVTDLPVRLGAAEQVGRIAERMDVLAFLSRKRRNAELIAAATAESDENYTLAKDRARLLSVTIEHIQAGLHEGQAEIERRLNEGLV